MSLRIIISFLIVLLGYSHSYAIYKRQFSYVSSNFKCEISHLESDELGFLWISTDEGLVRYDGFSYLRFQHNQDDTNSLPNNCCHRTFIDSKKNFWVATNSGLALLDRKTYNVKPIQLDNFETAIVDIAEDEDHSLWLLGYDAIYHYFPETGKTKAIRGNWGIRFIVTGSHIWVVSEHKGLSVINKNTMKAEPVSASISKSLFRIFQASDKTIFVGSTDAGIYIFSPDKQLLKHYTAMHDGALFSSNHICSFAEDANKNIWIGNVNGNLSIYNLTTKTFTPSQLIFPNDVNDKHITISSLLCDANNNVWVGTYRYWFFKSAKKDEIFTYYKMPESNPASSFLNTSNKILVGSDGGGVYTFEPLKKSSFSPTYGDNPLSVASIKAYKNETFVVAWGKGILTEQNGRLKPYCSQLPTVNLQDVLPTDSGLWVAADAYGLLFITKQGKVLTMENSNLPIFRIRLPHYPHHIFSDHMNRMWISTSNGICCWNGKEGRRYMLDEGNSNDIIMADDDSNNRIWFLSKSNGLCLLDPNSGKIDFYTDKFGLPAGLKALLIDDDDKLWITSSDHLYCINLRNNNVRNFDFSENLGTDVFHPRALYLAPDGVLYAGSSAGLLCVEAQAIHPFAKQNVVLSSFSILGEIQTPQSGFLKQDISVCDSIVLSHDQNFFSFSFVCPNYSGADKIEYYYKLSGLSDAWVKADGYNASFSSLAAGVYVLEVKAMAGSEELGSLSKPLTIVVSPAWWETWWFRTLILLAISLLVYSLFSYRVSFLRKQKNKLEMEVANRTQLLADRNKEILERNKDIELKNEELDVALSTKDKIISVIAHDLRNPLAVISGMLGLLRDNGDVKSSANLSKQVETVSNAALNLQGQMENLLQWARLRSSSVSFSATEVFLSFSVKGAISLLQDVARQKGITVRVNDNATHAAIADERMVATIARNLLANSIKFSYANSNIDVNIYEKGSSVFLSVTDYGVGMDHETANSLFSSTNKDTVVTSSNGTAGEEGAGLGLKLCYDFALRCNGTLSVKSEVGKGSVFTLELPKSSLERISYEKDSENADNPNLESSKEETKDTYEDADRKSILLIDDDTNLLTYLTAIFQGEYVVETATNGQEGLNVARKSLPDIIISDFMMPVMNGKDFCERIKNDILTQHIPVLLLTASDSEVTQLDSIAVGADDYILKPFRKEFLLTKVRSVLANKERQLQSLRNKIFDINTDPSETKTYESEFIEKATAVVKKHVGDSDFTAEVFASELAISRVQLFRKFKAVAATSPSDFVKQYRLVYASQLLTSGNTSVADVAYACGFSDPKYFSSCFSAKFGVSPSQYVKQQQ